MTGEDYTVGKELLRILHNRSAEISLSASDRNEITHNIAGGDKAWRVIPAVSRYSESALLRLKHN